MGMVLALVGLALIVLVLVDSFESIVLPRGVTRGYRSPRIYYLTTWKLWRTLALRLPAGKLREGFLSLFGPLSLLCLLATWVLGLIFAFAILLWSLGAAMTVPQGEAPFSTYFYWSGTTFF